jgi:hypothetical protein
MVVTTPCEIPLHLPNPFKNAPYSDIHPTQKSSSQLPNSPFSAIVTKTVKGVYQKYAYMTAAPAPKICLAQQAI